MFVCLLVFNKRQHGLTDRAQIFCGASRDPMGRFMDDRIFKFFFCNKIRFLKIWKSMNVFFIKSPIFCLFLFHNVNEEKMFTIEIEDWRKAPYKPSSLECI